MGKRNKNIFFRNCLFAFLVCFSLLCCSSPSQDVRNEHPGFRNIEIVLEYFPQSETVTGHFIVNPGFQLEDLVIQNPKNNTVLDFYSDNISIHPNYLEFSTSESPLSDFKKSFPGGEYRFSSWLATSSIYESIFNLSFGFTEPPEILFPPEKHILNNMENFILLWRKTDSPDSYILRIFEGKRLIYYSRLNRSINEVVLPYKYFDFNREYKVRLSAVNSNGNMTSSDLTFITSKDKKLKKNISNGG